MQVVAFATNFIGGVLKSNKSRIMRTSCIICQQQSNDANQKVCIDNEEKEIPRINENAGVRERRETNISVLNQVVGSGGLRIEFISRRRWLAYRSIDIRLLSNTGFVSTLPNQREMSVYILYELCVDY